MLILGCPLSEREPFTCQLRALTYSTHAKRMLFVRQGVNSESDSRSFYVTFEITRDLVKDGGEYRLDFTERGCGVYPHAVVVAEVVCNVLAIFGRQQIKWVSIRVVEG